MSRTYRKLRTKHGCPRWSMSRFDKLQRAHCNKQPEPYNVPMSLWEKYTYTYTMPPLEKDRVWVSKGTPYAQPEYHQVQQSWTRLNGDVVYYNVTRESGRYYLEGPETVHSITRTRYLGPNPEHDWDLSIQVWMQQRAFDHHRKNKTGYGCYHKKRDRKKLRIQGKSLVYEALNDFKYQQLCRGDYDRNQCVYYWNEHPQDSYEDHIDYFDDDWGSWKDVYRYDFSDPYDHDESDIDQWEGQYDDWDHDYYDCDYHPGYSLGDLLNSASSDRLTDRDDLFEELDKRNSDFF